MSGLSKPGDLVNEFAACACDITGVKPAGTTLELTAEP